MKVFPLIVALFAVSWVSTGLAYGQDDEDGSPDEEVTTSTKTKARRDYSRPSGMGLRLGGGIIGGMVSTDAELEGATGSGQGSLYGIRAMSLISYKTVSLELGLGFIHSTTKFAASESAVNAPNGNADGSLTLNAPMVDFSPALNISKRVAFGPVGAFTTGRYLPETSPDDTKSQNALVGPRLTYTIPEKRRSYRASLQYLTDINLETRRLSFITLTFDMNFSAFRGYTRVIEREKIEKHKIVVETKAEKVIEKKVVLVKVDVVMDAQTINFVTDKYDLVGPSAERVGRLGTFLASHPALWQRIIVEGHTDRRGDYSHNQQLSQNRAAAVVGGLVQRGVNQSLIVAQGLASDRPMDPADSAMAWARNRRVEIHFEGVSDEAALRTGVTEAMK